MIRVLIADDQDVVREGLSALLAYHKDLEIVGRAGNGLEACKLAKELKPDVILMDIRMPERDGIVATQEILRENPQVKILVLTTFDEDDMIETNSIEAVFQRKTSLNLLNQLHL